MSLTIYQQNVNQIATSYGLPKVYQSDDTVHPYWLFEHLYRINIEYFEQLCIMRSYKRKGGEIIV